MKSGPIIYLLFGLFFTERHPPTGITLSEFLKPKCDTLFYNCVYNSYHATGLRDTVRLVWRMFPVGQDTAYYLTSPSDSDGRWAQWQSFSGSALIYKHDSVWLASLTDNQSARELTRDHFTHVLPPHLTFPQPLELAELKWHFIMKVLIRSVQFEDVTIGNRVLKKCLRLNLLVYDRSTKPDQATVWLSRDYGTVKWIRTTGRTEVLDLARFKKA